MKTGAFLDALRSMPVTSPEALTEGRPFLVLSPHPDDESLGTGGLIAAACAAGQRAEVVILTDGSGSHTRSTLYPRDRLVALRQAEAAQAAAALGLSAERVLHLGLRDADTPKDGPVFDATVERLESLVAVTDAASLFVTWGHDPHCDHEAADAIARAVRRRRPSLRLWSYPIWGWHLDPESSIDEPPPQGFRIDISPWREQKRAAIAAHASQMTDLIPDDPEGFRFDAQTVAPFIGPYEYVFEVPA